MTICIVDTSILDELLNVPGKASRHVETVAEFEVKQGAREQFLMPIAVMIETGNHIAHCSEGDVRRSRAMTFVEFARTALSGSSPFVATPFPDVNALHGWLDDFPAHAMRSIGLADRSLIALWDEQRELHRTRRVYIWSLDKELHARDTGAR